MTKRSFRVSDTVTFKSSDGKFSIDNLTAEIEEIASLTTDTVFPNKVAYLIRFTSNNRCTWCKENELTLIE